MATATATTTRRCRPAAVGAGGASGRSARARLWRRCCREDHATPAPISASCRTASVAAVPMSPSCVAWRQISTSIVDVPASPSTRMTPNDVNVNTKTIDAAARIAGRSSGSVTSRNARHGGAPSVRRGGLEVRRQLLHTAPTVRTTTARLNRTWATRIAGDAALDACGEQGEDGGAHDHGRQHERGDEQAGQQPPSGEGVAGEHVRRGEPEHDRQHGADDGLPQREPGDSPRRAAAERVARPSPVSAHGRAASTNGHT